MSAPVAAELTAVEMLVQSYYGRSDLLQGGEAGLRKAGIDPQKPGFHTWPRYLGNQGACGANRNRAPACKSLDLGSGLGRFGIEILRPGQSPE